MSRSTLRLLVIPGLVLAVAGGMAPSAPLDAQDGTTDELRREIQESQLRLEAVREERAQLQREIAELRSRVADVSGELRNIERQISTSRSVLAEIEFQVDATTARVEGVTGDLFRTRQELRERQAVLNRRLRAIYKRGPLHTIEVLLGADSFSDLLNRYRYLQMVALHDQNLLRAVRSLESELDHQTREMSESLAELDRLRQFQLGEVAELRQVEAERLRTLDQFRTRADQTASRVDQLEADEGRLSRLVQELDSRPGPGLSISGGGPGARGEIAGRTLPWPVEGELRYRFGPERRPNGTVLRWNGIGISAPRGTPVRSVLGGVVALAGPFEGYGPTVILNHGDGVYTLYLYLEEVGVVAGREVEAGQVVGTVGGGASHDAPYIEFQIRAPMEDNIPRAQDPLEWLVPGGSP
jgi:murein hydrolase activator